MAMYVYTAGIPFWTEWDTLDIEILLMKSGYTPDVDHATVAAVASGNELDDTDTYERKTLVCSAPVIETANDWYKYDAADITWAALDTPGDEIVTGCLIYNLVTNDSDSIPMVYFNFTGVNPDGADFTIAFSSNGVLTAMQG
jgi:hypothetical protein